MGGAAALLGRRGALLAAVAGVLTVYYALVTDLWSAPLWWDVAWLALVLIPAVFALVWLALPLWRERALPFAALGAGAAAAGCELVGWEIPANFAKLAAMTLVAWWFLTFFEALWWVVLVACIIPFVDAYSVWRGPTKHIVEERHDVFQTLSVAFPEPGATSSAHLGLPDVLFFGLFLATSVRFGLRPRWTWVGMTLSIGATMALAVWLDRGGLPALPLISAGFLLPNADLIWRRLRALRAAARARSE